MKKAQQPDFPRFEEELLDAWDKEQTFKQSLENRKDAKPFRFYDGPPFANGLPHYGHALASAEKDAITRYRTMRGYYVPRRAGWDTHGLPVEYEVEKQLGLKNKRAIIEYGVDKFNEAARKSVFKYQREWIAFYKRFGRWIDTENAYATLDDSYIESVWWVFSELAKKDLVYRDFRSSPYCPRCATPLSNFELNQGYQDGVEDPSVFALFPVVGEDQTSLLAWTTTPWTLPANAALAVDEKADYVTVQLQDDGDSWSKGDKLILAKERLDQLELRKAEYKVVKTQKGKELVGLKYQPLYEVKLTDEERQAAYTVFADESVDLDDGTGVLHVAPRYGESDLIIGQREGLPLIESVDADGRMTDAAPEFKGQFFKEADPHIIADLTQKGRIFAAETFTHTYPFCWRCDTPLMYFATPSWFVKVASLRDRLVAANKEIKWVPEHVKEGRFGNWLAEARDWSVSRNRFWGAPIPIWVNEKDETDYLVISSLEELRELSGHQGEFDLHRPGIDEIVINKDGKTYRRVEEVFDCWFESGSMPYAEDHYPFEHQNEFKSNFPADFIAESMDQTRGWFYTLHVLATALFDQPSFKNVIVSGIVVAADGKKLSKRLKNYPDINEIFSKYGADSLRYFLASSPAVAGEDVRFSDEAVRDVYRNVFMTLWNVHSFFTTYAEIDGWKPGKNLEEPDVSNPLDEWILGRVNKAVRDMTYDADNYEINRATRPLRDLIDDLSNWYVRRSRRRFWKSEDDNDKQSAYATLHFVLLRIAQLLAPWSPFLPDKIWRDLTEEMDVPSSVHLSDWPEHRDPKGHIGSAMPLIREAVTKGLAVRAENGIKVRQPLASATVRYSSGWQKLVRDDIERLADIAKDELNVKVIEFVPTDKLKENQVEIDIDTEITPELKREGLMRDVVRVVQNARKEAGLNVDDRIELKLETDDGELSKAIEEHRETIAIETLASGWEPGEGHSSEAKVGATELQITLKKA